MNIIYSNDNQELWVKIADELTAIIKAFDVEQKAIIEYFDDYSGLEISYKGIKTLNDIPYAYDKDGNDVGYDGPYGYVQYTEDPYFNWFWQKLQDIVEDYMTAHPGLIEDYELDWYSEVSILINFK